MDILLRRRRELRDSWYAYNAEHDRADTAEYTMREISRRLDGVAAVDIITGDDWRLEDCRQLVAMYNDWYV